ncbi:MAG: hypothetical protein ABSH51_28310 [Solirubrobacteraceae bacterium]|jgi:hypothetical protein
MNEYRSVKRVFTLGSRHPLQVALVRVGVGIWLLCLTASLSHSGYDGVWPWLLPATAALHFILAYRLVRIARTRRDRGARGA